MHQLQRNPCDVNTMYRQKATSRAYVVICSLLVVIIICIITSLVIDMHYRHQSMVREETSYIQIAEDSDIVRCLRLSSDDEIDLKDRAYCVEAAAIFSKMSKSSTSANHRDVVNKAISGCDGFVRRNGFLVPCNGRPKPRLLSTSTSNQTSLDNFIVPNIVHFIRYGNMSFDFQQYVSMYSVHKFQIPIAIFIHGDSLPDKSNTWWNKALHDIPNIYHIQRTLPTHIFNREISYIEHASDFSRLQILLEYGGIYLDHDVLMVKSMNALRNYPATLGREMPSLLANGVIIAKRKSKFLSIWLETYKNYDRNSWSGHSTHTPHSLSVLLPHLLHIEDKSLVHPTWNELQILYRGHYSRWRKDNYCIHLYLQERYPDKVPSDHSQLRKLDNTVGEVMRYIMYGR